MSAHTPGPWTAHAARFPTDGETDYAIAADRLIIAEAFGRVSETERAPAEANARLIAAAPDLLEALEAMFACHLGGDQEDLVRALDLARGALAKAAP